MESDGLQQALSCARMDGCCSAVMDPCRGFTIKGHRFMRDTGFEYPLVHIAATPPCPPEGGGIGTGAGAAELKEPSDTAPRRRVWVVQCGARSWTAFQLGIFCVLCHAGPDPPGSAHRSSRSRQLLTEQSAVLRADGREGRSEAPPRAPPEGPPPREATSGGGAVSLSALTSARRRHGNGPSRCPGPCGRGRSSSRRDRAPWRRRLGDTRADRRPATRYCPPAPGPRRREAERP